MSEMADHLAGRTVRPYLTLVNRVVTMRAEEGERLRGYVEAHWNRRKGGVRGLCRKLNASPETIYSWYRGETEPNLGSLEALATALEVRRWEIVAAMDGDLVLAAADERTRQALRAEIEAVLDERLGPRKEARARAGAA